MKSGKVHQAEDEEDEQTPPSIIKDGKSNEKAPVTRSKHSVTEQRRRSKINERLIFQILRDFIPHSDQKRDTASFLVEVIEYVQYLQDKVQKYEGSFQEWNSEPTKLMPWRNSHWRGQSFGGPIQLEKNDGGLASTFPARFDDNDINTTQTMPSNQLNDVSTSSGGVFPHLLQSNGTPILNDALHQQEDMTIEGGTINIRSVYTQGLLSNITQALQNAGVDLSQASVSVQIDLGKRANRESAYVGASSNPKDVEGSSVHQQTGLYGNVSNGSELNQTQKRPKI